MQRIQVLVEPRFSCVVADANLRRLFHVLHRACNFRWRRWSSPLEVPNLHPYVISCAENRRGALLQCPLILLFMPGAGNKEKVSPFVIDDFDGRIHKTNCKRPYSVCAREQDGWRFQKGSFFSIV